MGPNLFAELIKRGEVHDATATAAQPTTAMEFTKALYPGVDITPADAPAAKQTGSYTKSVDNPYPTGDDTAEPIAALGSMSGDVSTQDEDSIDVPVEDAFSRHVRALVTSGGGEYQVPSTTVKVDRGVIEAATRLQKNAGFLNRLVAKANLRRAAQGKPPIGSATVSASTV